MLEKVTENYIYQKLTEDEMKDRGILGRLVGNVADFINPTRNGRKYTEELWEKVFDNKFMKEKFKNKVMYGELGHPEDRTEVDMEKVAICMAEPPKKDKDGTLKAVFDILSTPNGKILKTLCDYGSTLGISSRGTGDVIEDDEGNEIVDPETYDCECWDIVLIPAVESARLNYVTEGLDKNKLKLKETLKESVDNSSEDEQRIMKETLKELKINIEEAVESEEKEEEPEEVLEDKIEYREYLIIPQKFNLVVDDKDYGELCFYHIIDNNDELIVVKNENDEDINLHSVEECKEYIDKLLDVSSQEEIENKDAEEKEEEPEEVIDDESTEVIDNFTEALKKNSELESTVKTLQEQLAVRDSKVNKLNEELAENKLNSKQIKSLTFGLKRAELKTKSTLEDYKKLEKEFNQFKEDVNSKSVKKDNSLTEAVTRNKSIIKNLQERLKTSKDKYESTISNLNESLNSEKQKAEKLTEKLNEAQKSAKSYKTLANESVNKYIDLKADLIGVSSKIIKDKLPDSYSFDDIENLCEELQSYNLSINKLSLPLDMLKKNAKVKITESKITSNVVKTDDDDIDDDLLKLTQYL